MSENRNHIILMPIKQCFVVLKHCKLLIVIIRKACPSTLVGKLHCIRVRLPDTVKAATDYNLDKRIYNSCKKVAGSALKTYGNSFDNYIEYTRETHDRLQTLPENTVVSVGAAGVLLLRQILSFKAVYEDGKFVLHSLVRTGICDDQGVILREPQWEQAVEDDHLLPHHDINWVVDNYEVEDK